MKCYNCKHKLECEVFERLLEANKQNKKEYQAIVECENWILADTEELNTKKVGG